MCNIAVAVGEVDHKVALVNGGTDTEDNLWLLCKECHYYKTREDLGQKVKTAIKKDGTPSNPNHHWNQ